MSISILARVAVLFLISLLVLTSDSHFGNALTTAEAAGARARKRTRSARAKRAARRALQRRTISKRRVPSRTSRATAPVPGSYPLAPDQIEVIEHGPAAQSSAHPLTALPRPAARANANPNANHSSLPAMPNISRRRISTRIDGDRVIEIQQALRDRGIFEGEPTGVYDESTIESMRRFQLKERINATGYPTAHALKRLGLAR